MRVLFDQATPVPIRSFLVGHTVRTAAQQAWDTLQNGDLLTVAEQAGFELHRGGYSDRLTARLVPSAGSPPRAAGLPPGSRWRLS
jgi:hypothetical protein